MPKNIFLQQKDAVESVPRNTFDLSFQYNGTFNFGTLFPVLCKEVVPGSSINITPTFALQALPTFFPIQTRVRANLHFYAVRKRILWDGFKDWYGNTNTSSSLSDSYPYIFSTSGDIFKTGSLGDYLGLPTTIYGNYGSNKYFNATYQSFDNNKTKRNISTYAGSGLTSVDDFISHLDSESLPITIPFGSSSSGSASNFYGLLYQVSLSDFTLFPQRVFLSTPSWMYKSAPTSKDLFISIATTNHVSITGSQLNSFDITTKLNYCKVTLTMNHDNSFCYFDFPDTFLDRIHQVSTASIYFMILSNLNGLYSPSSSSITTQLYRGATELRFAIGSDSSSIDAIDYDLCPFAFAPGSITPTLPISALPFRAYESIYNAFYRNDINDPLIINGNPAYNTYVPNSSGGADAYPYKLYSRPWEQDAYTSAVQSPQQGVAPLVGITSFGRMTFADPDDSSKTYDVQMNVDDDGRLSGIQVADPNLPKGTLRSLVDVVSSGISINDFRNVNSLQRWLEKQVRRGFKYKDQIMSHFGVEVSLKELDMPEFIGGMSLPVIPNKVSQTTETEDTPLADFAGQMSCIGTSQHSISYYADEPCYIMAILSINPVPVYSQRLDKMWTRFDTFDNYFPEFGQIGYQPIFDKEIAPLQVFAAGDNLNNVFGYQRPWYDYISSVDEVHGQMRTNLRDYLINRVFDTRPVLNNDFIYINGSHLNDVFNWRDDTTDKFMGQIFYDFTLKAPIPRVNIPRLE